MTGRKDKTPDETRPPEPKSGESKPKGRKITGRLSAPIEKSSHAWKAQTGEEVVADLKGAIKKLRGPEPRDPVTDAIKADARQAITEIKLRRGGVSKRPGKPRIKAKSTDKGEKGRPPALTPEVQAEIIHSVSKLGMAETRAARASGFDSTIVGKWKARGQRAFEEWETLTPEDQESEARYVAFFHALRDSDYQFESVHLGRIEKASEKDFRASVRLLEWKYPLRYGKRLMHGGDPANPTPIPVSTPADEMTDEEATARAQRILNAHRASEKPSKKKG
jgi:hypothetical protein